MKKGCDCQHCRMRDLEALNSEFIKIIHASWTVAEEFNLDLEIEQCQEKIEEIVERLSAYGKQKWDENGPAIEGVWM